MAKPNILIVMMDHQRADTTFPGAPTLTPNVDQLASEGVLFSNAFCPSPHCCPSRATFYTGHYPSRHGIWNNICNRMALNTGLADGIRLWSEDLAEAGYQQHFIGKWHVSAEESPANRGWVEHTVSGTAADHHGRRWKQYQQMAVEPESSRRAEGQILRPGYGTYTLYGVDQRKAHRHDETVLQETLQALEQLTHQDQPWVLYAGFIGPHDPYVVPQEFLDLYPLEDIELPESYHDTLVDKPAVYRRMRSQIFGQLDEREVREGIRHFYAYCSYLDDCFGQIMRVLDRSSQADNTLVVYTSDHGDYNGDHGLFAKGVPCFDGAYRVPAVMRWRSGIHHPDRVVDALVSLADFAPTFLEVAGLPANRDFAGYSLVPFLQGGQPESWRDAVFTQLNGVELYYCQRSVRTQDYRYTFNGFDQDELYDLRQDPHQMVNLADAPEYEPVKRALCRRMWQFAYAQDDPMINPYITVGLAPYGPAEAFRD
ncbi:MAG: sulfatase-like hydrolase/transferase [Anaerolineae bacterium]|nr:sulfatase-like hydrolase/transferase [Anaerolineae bacterium]